MSSTKRISMNLHTFRILLTSAIVALTSALPAQVCAQDDSGIDTTLKPRPAEPATHAVRALLLDVTRAGDNWIAVGAHGIVLRSADGEHWAQMPTPVDVPLTRVRFFDEDHGWAIGYDGAVLSSDNGGRRWQLKDFDAAWGRPWYDIRFLDAQHGWLAGANGMLKRSDDGGASWTTVESPVLADQPNLYNLTVLNDGSLLLAGERGFLARSQDHGDHWQRLRSPYSGSFFGTVAIGSRGALVFGLRGNAFYAADLDKAPQLTVAEAEALRLAAADAENASKEVDPVTAVPGWAPLKNRDHESLFGGAALPDGSALLLGGNGHVLHADLAHTALVSLSPLQASSGRQANPAAGGGTGPGHTSLLVMAINAGALHERQLVVVGTDGVQQLTLPIELTR